MRGWAASVPSLWPSHRCGEKVQAQARYPAIAHKFRGKDTAELLLHATADGAGKGSGCRHSKGVFARRQRPRDSARANLGMDVSGTPGSRPGQRGKWQDHCHASS